MWRLDENGIPGATDKVDMRSVFLDSVGLTVEAQDGSGYYQSRTTTHVPLDILLDVLRREGYVVTTPGPQPDGAEE